MVGDSRKIYMFPESLGYLNNGEYDLPNWRNTMPLVLSSQNLNVLHFLLSTNPSHPSPIFCALLFLPRWHSLSNLLLHPHASDESRKYSVTTTMDRVSGRWSGQGASLWGVHFVSWVEAADFPILILDSWKDWPHKATPDHQWRRQTIGSQEIRGLRRHQGGWASEMALNTPAVVSAIQTLCWLPKDEEGLWRHRGRPFLCTQRPAYIPMQNEEHSGSGSRRCLVKRKLSEGTGRQCVRKGHWPQSISGGWIHCKCMSSGTGKN